MARLFVHGDDLLLTLTWCEKLNAFCGDIRVPVSAVQQVEVIDDVVHAAYGIKLPGTRWPGKIAVGTFISLSGTRMLAEIHHEMPRGLLFRLSGADYDQLVIGCEDPEEAKGRLEFD